eukprot:gene2838-5585_t
MSLLLTVTVSFMISQSAKCLRKSQFNDKDINVCGDTIGPFFDVVADDGFSSSCFVNRPMSFESCRLFLAEDDNCSALTYRQGRCFLHDRRAANFLLKRTASDAIFYIKLSQDLDTCYEGIASASTLREKYLTCTSLHTLSISSSLLWSQLPRLAIVMSVTSTWADKHKDGLAAVTSNFKCYCNIHNYTFILNMLPSMSAARFFTARHESVLREYLPHYQHVMHVDADSLVLNLSKSLDKYLDEPYDVQLHMHENGEVTAATYLLRNSQVARCFMRYWLGWSPPHVSTNSKRHVELTYETLNYDNGDLVAALMELIDPQHARSCMRTVQSHYPSSTSSSSSSQNPYLDTVVACFQELMPRLSSSLSAVSPRIRIFLPREGFWRTHARRGRFKSWSGSGSWWDELLGSCFSSSDVIGHGWKAMPRKLWGVDGRCDITVARSGLGANGRCMWHSAEDERAVANRFCTWKSPICFLHHPYTGSTTKFITNASRVPINMCLQEGSGCMEWQMLQREQGRQRQRQLFNISSESWIRQQLCSSCPIPLQ